MFPPNSRYHGAAIAVHVDTEGREVRHLRRRFIPGAASLASIEHHLVSDGDRPDTIAAATLGDPELYWQLCDGNGVMHPRELTAVPGRTLRVTLPAGIPAP
ncbi:MAG: LysM domain-containing protein [Puniceicoccaceae bacterium]|nr:MAG: LysM domain-containing protein [Puniceicoccaceae bacterium]